MPAATSLLQIFSSTQSVEATASARRGGSIHQRARANIDRAVSERYHQRFGARIAEARLLSVSKIISFAWAMSSP